MTLTVDEVRNIRFPMARQPNEDGYRASAVDNFIDRLEVSYAEIVDENQRLKSSSGGGDAAQSQLAALAKERDDLSALKSQLTTQNSDLLSKNADLTARLTAIPSADPNRLVSLQSQIDELTRINQDLRGQLATRPSDQSGQLAQVNQQLAQSSQQLAQAGQDNVALQAKVGVLQNQVNDLTAKLAAQPVAEPAVEGETRHIVVSTSSEAAPAVVLLVEQTLQQVQTLMDNAQVEIDQRRGEAEVEARRLVESATQQAEDLSRRAQTDADSIHTDASASADRLVAEARTRAAAVDAESEQRRAQMQVQLDKERETLSDRIGQLRDFEAQYRKGMADHLQRQIDSLNETQFAPSYHPGLLDAASVNDQPGDNQ